MRLGLTESEGISSMEVRHFPDLGSGMNRSEAFPGDFRRL